MIEKTIIPPPPDVLKISYSSLSTYLTCPLQWKFSKVLKVKSKPQDEFAAYIGSMVQYHFEQLTNHKIYEKTDLKTFMETIKSGLPEAIKQTTYHMTSEKPEYTGGKYYKDLQIMGIDYSVHTHYELEEAIVELLDINIPKYWEGKVFGSISAIECEKEITFSEETKCGNKYSLIGFADFVIKGEDGYEVADGKKKYNSKYHKPEQIGIYLWGLKKDGHQINPNSKFWSYSTGRLHNVKIDLNKTKEWMDTTVDLIQDAWKNDNFPKNNQQQGTCTFCPYISICV